ncbi:MAG TPA: AraC family transcriptional regulator [Bryobacteraceae bacterium]|nr:AraC family transcriptional regulator [Bryobacteraceae bacterium]
MDAFSEILSGVKLSGALFFRAEFSAPWCFASPASNTLAPLLAPGAPHLVIYHFVIDGAAFVTLPDGASIELGPGDIVVLPHGDPHVMTSARGLMGEALTSAILSKIKSRDLRPMQAGGGGDSARYVCGYMACDPFLSRPILGGLPPVFKVNIRTDRSGHWLENSILHLVEEAASGRVGSDAMLAKLSEALFVDTLRRYVASLPEQQTGWLAGARDPIVGKSLGLLHSRIAHPWTIADLADEVGISRTALAERFTRYLSEPPMTYLTRWRLQLAARSLENTPRGVSEIAGEVGYESEAAFNRAFKREFGEPPGRYRLNHKRTSSKSTNVDARPAGVKVNSSSDDLAERIGISSHGSGARRR